MEEGPAAMTRMLRLSTDVEGEWQGRGVVKRIL